MFEKETEKIAKDIYIHHFDNDINYPEVLKAITEGFQEGAVFGYNKANEWHYPLKGEFPTENIMLLLARKTVNGIQALIGYYRKEQFEVFNEKSCKMNSIDSVYAWKKIALPELPKENERMKLEEYLTIDCNNNDRFFDCMHGYIYAIPEHNVYLHKCNVQEECNCVGCNNFIPKIVKKESK